MITSKLIIDSQKPIVITMDSGGRKKIKGEWLLGRTLSFFRGKWSNYIVKYDKDKYEQWSAVIFTMNNKSLLIIILYRLPDGSRKGIYTVKV